MEGSVPESGARGVSHRQSLWIKMSFLKCRGRFGDVVSAESCATTTARAQPNQHSSRTKKSRMAFFHQAC